MSGRQITAPRRCLGEHFAMMEGVLALAIILQKFRLSLAPGQAVEAEASITLRPRRGLYMTLHEALYAVKDESSSR